MGRPITSSKIVKSQTNLKAVSKAKRKNTKRKSPKIKSSKPKKTRLRWQDYETIKYCQFIKENEKTLQMREKRDKQKIFNDMQSFVLTRTKRQCKSHHQKMLKRYGSISNILSKHSEMIKGTHIIHQDIDDHVQKEMSSIGTQSNLKTQKHKETDMIGSDFFYGSENKNMVPEDSVSQDSKQQKSQLSQNQESYLNRIIALSSSFYEKEEIFYE